MRPIRRYRTDDHIAKSRNPDLAPHCSQCGYNLHGNVELRCPECGHRASFDEAHWAGNAARLDRSAVRVNWIAGMLGWVMLAAGTTIWILELRNREYMSAFFWFRGGGADLVVIWAILYAMREEGEPRGKALLIIGALWLTICFALWYIG